MNSVLSVLDRLEASQNRPYLIDCVGIDLQPAHQGLSVTVNQRAPARCGGPTHLFEPGEKQTSFSLLDSRLLTSCLSSATMLLIPAATLVIF